MGASVALRGNDPAGYAEAVNVNRRNHTQGQKAMIAVRIHFIKNEKLSRDDVQELVPATGTSKSGIFRAAFVHRHAPDLADSVIAGDTEWTLDKAYAEARAQSRRGVNRCGTQSVRGAFTR